MPNIKNIFAIVILCAISCTIAQGQQYKKISNNEKLFYLDKSNRHFYLDKQTTPFRISQIDSMLISALAKGDLTDIDKGRCQTYSSIGIEVGDDYLPVNDRSLGVWVSPDLELYKKVHRYGFRKILVTIYDDPEAIRKAGYSNEDMMYHLVKPEQEILPNAGSYYIDEPFEKYRNDWNKEKILNIARKVYPKKLFIGSYRWPNASLFNFFSGNGNEYWDLLNTDFTLPIHIMCDEYNGNCSGGVNDFWNEFRNVFGEHKNISNWISNCLNSGDGSTNRNCFFNSEESANFYDLIKDATVHNTKELWLFAYFDCWNENNIRKFINTAWDMNWVYRKGKEVIITWKCIYYTESDPCAQCNYGNNKGFWIPVKYSYTGKEYLLEAGK